MVAAQELFGVALAAGAAVVLAVQTLTIRVGTDRAAAAGAGRVTDPLVTTLAANAVVFGALSAVLYAPPYGLSWRAALMFVAGGVVGFLLGRLCHYWAIQLIGASRAAPIKASQPLHATLIAIVVLGEQVGGLHFLGVLLITGGVAAVSWDTARDNPLNLRGWERWRGVAIAVAGAFFYGLEPIFTKVGLDTGTPVLVGAGIESATALVCVLAYRRYRLGTVRFPDPRSDGGRWYLAAAVLNTLFVAAYFAALQVGRVAVVIPIIQLSPLFVIGLSAVFLRRLERVTWKLAAATLVVIAGSVLVTVFG